MGAPDYAPDYDSEDYDEGDYAKGAYAYDVRSWRGGGVKK